MAYALFRVSVVPRLQASLFGEAPPAAARPDDEARAKAEVVRRAFTTFAEFQHLRARLYLVHRHSADHFVGGYISKASSVRVRTSPMPREEPQLVLDHPRANYFLSLAPDESSQILAIQIVDAVGKPTAIIKSLIEHINLSSLADDNYHLVVFPILAKGDYIAAAKQYEGQITEVGFTFVVPNVRFLPSGLRETLEQARDEDGAQEVGYAVRNADGNVNAKSDRLTGMAEEAEQGLGSVFIRALKKIVYRSDQKVKSVDIENKTSIDDMDSASFEATAQDLFNKWER